LRFALKSGVKIAHGTDIGEGDHSEEITLLVGNGMPAAEALVAATRKAADLIGAAAEIGTVQAGRYADIVATSGDPLRDPAQFRHVHFVMKGGLIF
jgi:imidazolonepropionase-like amidohydrolase